jgi:hypothetical protein
MTTATRTKAEALAEQAHTWARGTSKIDGRSFYVVPASDGVSAHYATSYGCTCRGFERRGECSHREAVRLHEAHERDIEAAFRDLAASKRAQTLRSYSDLFPPTDWD